MLASRSPLLLMGILNLTPDSFWDGGKYQSIGAAVRRARSLTAAGADMLDIGAESTRPGSKPISLAEERKRLLPVLEKLIPALSIPVCVDTTKSQIAREALSLGARIINDTSALADARMVEVVSKANATVILMHRKGSSLSMQQRPVYRDCVGEIENFLLKRIAHARKAGIPNERIWIDPGIGFGKTLAHNLEILRNLESFVSMGHKVVIGVSRKSFLGMLVDARVEQRLASSLTAGIVAALRGASVLRVHDVRETAHARKILEALDALQFNHAHKKISC